MSVTLGHPRESVDGQPVENTFIAYEAQTAKRVAACTIFCDENPSLYPTRPFQARLQFDGEPLPDQLLGAGVARGLEICSASGVNARLYTRCDPDDDALMETLLSMGFSDNDGLVRMQMRLPCASDYHLPSNCVVVKDDLSDAMEQRYFLERYNELYNTRHDFQWLHSFIDRPGFMRILSVSPTGMAGEILIWQEGNSGIIGYIQTSKRWRHMGIGRCMIGLACEEFEHSRLYYAEANVRARIPHVLRLMEGMGFKQAELLMRYPGVDVNPPLPDDDLL